MEKLLKRFLVLNDYKYLTEEFTDLFLSHPNYPSLFAINDTLDMLKIENIATRISIDQFEDLPDSFLALINESSISEELVLIEKKDLNILVHYKNQNSIILNRNDFNDIWTGIVLGLEANTEKKGNANIKSKYWFYLVPTVFIFGFIFYNSFNWINLVFFFSTLIGLIFSIFIIQEKFNLTEESLFKFCSLSKEVSCNSVIKSDQQFFFGLLSFSDLPLIFFGSSFFSFIFNTYKATLTIGMLSIVAIPFILYSIWLQKVKLKKWCLLCLIISCILLFNAGFYYSVLFEGNFYSYSIYFEYIISLVLVMSSWLIIKPIISKNIDLNTQNKELKRFKRNYKIFKLLTDSKLVLEEKFHNLDKIFVGNSDAKIELNLILSPNCKYCHIAFKEGVDLVKNYPDKISLSILFNINKDNPSVTIPCKILQIKKNNPEKVAEALSDWHIDNLPIEDWNKKWDIVIEDETKVQIQTQYDWFEKNGFNSVPVKLINGSIYPSEYDLLDLKYFISEMAEDAIS